MGRHYRGVYFEDILYPMGAFAQILRGNSCCRAIGGDVPVLIDPGL